jgi:hypothetical protein
MSQIELSSFDQTYQQIPAIRADLFIILIEKSLNFFAQLDECSLAFEDSILIRVSKNQFRLLAGN